MDAAERPTRRGNTRANGRLIFDPREHISAFDLRVLEWLRKRHRPQLTRALRAVTELGSLAGVTTIVSGTAILFWARGQRRDALFVACAGAGAGALSEALKRVFERQRPARGWRLAKTIGFTFPSGHSAASAATYGALALVLDGRGHRRLARLVGTLVPAAVGASRVYLSVHYPSDVVVGWALGAAWLAIVRQLIRLPVPR